MIAVRNFALIAGAVGLGWLLWRVNGAIGDQALMLVLGIILGLLAAAPLALVVLAHKQRPPENPDPQPYERQPPVVLLLPSGQRSTEAPYRAPAGLLLPNGQRSPETPYRPPADLCAPPSARTVGEREQWVQDEW